MNTQRSLYCFVVFFILIGTPYCCGLVLIYIAILQQSTKIHRIFYFVLVIFYELFRCDKSKFKMIHSKNRRPCIARVGIPSWMNGVCEWSNQNNSRTNLFFNKENHNSYVATKVKTIFLWNIFLKSFFYPSIGRNAQNKVISVSTY